MSRGAALYRVGAIVLLGLTLAFPRLAAASPGEDVAASPLSTGWVEHWADIDRLVAADKLAEALPRVAKRLGEARAAGDDEGWTLALLEATWLRTKLDSPEDAAQFLHGETWPSGSLDRALLDLYYAETLGRYLASSWEIRQREKIESAVELPLEQWTAAQITEAARAAGRDAWSRRQEIGDAPLSRLAPYLQPNGYPAAVRGTVRDALSYRYAELLANPILGSEEGSAAAEDLDLPALLLNPANPAADPKSPPPLHPLHPFQEMVAVLGDLEAWHLAAGRREAALEARRFRVLLLAGIFTDAEDLRLLRRDLEEHLDAARDLPWWSMGKATLADLWQRDPAPGHLAEARAAALAGRDAWPGSAGGERCRSIVETIEAPGFRLQAMASDGLGRRSIEVRHKNLEEMYFRAYPSALLASQARVVGDLKQPLDALQTLLQTGRPVRSWRSELAPTPDFDWHTTWVVPPLDHPDAYVVVASTREDFASPEGDLAAVRIVLGDLVLLDRGSVEGAGQDVELLALSGATGEPLAGVEVSFDRPGETSRKIGATGADGTLRIPLAAGQSASVIGNSPAGSAWLGLSPPYGDWKDSASVQVYTDRAIYRPGQKIFFKVLAFRGSFSAGRYRVLAGETVKVTLRGANSEEVASQTVTTNGFGTASGEFLIPPGRLLGAWQIQASLAVQAAEDRSGSASVRVEEYKRPTFEIVLDDPAAPLRLGAPAKLHGRAVYYFGLPVTQGQVRWRVNRRSRVLAMGTAVPDADGSFEIAFTPRPSRRQDEATDEYSVSLSLTDAGGETREAERSFEIGRASVTAEILSDHGFLLAGRPATLTVTRRDLSGAPRPGAGSWSLYELRQPAEALLPADEPVPGDGGDAGDALPARWERFRSPEEVLRAWPTGPRLKGGELRHRAGGVATVRLPALRPGAYRLRYVTRDDFGTRVEAQKEILVAGPRTPLALPAVLRVENAKVSVGGTARLFVHSGFPGQTFFLEVWSGDRRLERRTFHGGESPAVIERPIGAADRGGLSFKLLMVRDHQICDLDASITVPWDDRALRVEFATFRDRLRPGARETWKVTVRPPVGEAPETAAAEVLATMTDRSLDLFAQNDPPDLLDLYPDRTGIPILTSSLGTGSEIEAVRRPPGVELPELPGDLLRFPDFGNTRMVVGSQTWSAQRVEEAIVVTAEAPKLELRSYSTAAASTTSGVPVARNPAEVFLTRKENPRGDLSHPGPPRRNFAETAFWQPHLLTGADGTATIEFTVPDSVTAWNIFVQAVTRDLRSGTLKKEARSARDLLVRPYLPRFLREGDRARLEVVVTNARQTPLRGEVTLDLTDPESGRSVLADFGFPGLPAGATGTVRLPFTAPAGGGTTVVFPLTAPKRMGSVDFKVQATAGDESDGEERPLPVLPSRVHLAQSRHAVLQGAERKELRFEDLEKNDDPTRRNEQLVVTVDGQLFEGLLAALPYLVHYPHECAEQTLNRFVSTAIVTSLFDRYPGVAKLAADLAKRETRNETWEAADSNREITLEETPFLVTAKGGDERDLLDVLDPRIARAQRDDAFAKLTQMQLPSGAFPWWPGGPASPYMTAYLVASLSRAAEFGIATPPSERDLVRRAWSYLAGVYHQELWERRPGGELPALPVLLNYAASSSPDQEWLDQVLPPAERRQLLDRSFERWTGLSPYLRSLLALTLKRQGRPDDARRVFDSVLDRAKTTPEEGTFFPPEERAWLWYNDPIESHAFVLRALLELRPDDPRRHGLVQWLFLHKQLSHWKSTRATAEVLYAVALYLQKEKALGVTEKATVQAAGETTTFTFSPDRYTGKENRVIVPLGPGARIDPAHSAVTVEKETPGFLLASATWHFSTEAPPSAGSGDLFTVSRRYFLRVPAGVLKPLEEGAVLKLGDEVEVQLTMHTRSPAEYVQLRDPRPAGLEPAGETSGWQWGRGLPVYEEVRDSATSFFFEALSSGEVTVSYRVRANLAGEFRVGPATVQSMYAPEFVAYSGAGVVRIDASR